MSAALRLGAIEDLDRLSVTKFEANRGAGAGQAAATPLCEIERIALAVAPLHLAGLGFVVEMKKATIHAAILVALFNGSLYRLALPAGF